MPTHMWQRDTQMIWYNKKAQANINTDYARRTSLISIHSFL